MIPKEIAKFEHVRVQARSYLCLLLNRSIPNYLPDPDINTIIDGLKILKKESIKVEALYILNAKGQQISKSSQKIQIFVPQNLKIIVGEHIIIEQLERKSVL